MEEFHFSSPAAFLCRLHLPVLDRIIIMNNIMVQVIMIGFRCFVFSSLQLHFHWVNFIHRIAREWYNFAKCFSNKNLKFHFHELKNNLGISPISWLLIGELFPLEYRGIGSSIATSFSYFCAFLAVKTFVDIKVSVLSEEEEL